MIDAPRLLRDLQGDLGPLVSDLGAKVKSDEDVRARLDREWRTAFDAHRTGRSFEDWLEDRLTQVAVAWVLACVFVRFCEDNHLIDEATIAGPGERGDAARAAQQRYFTEHPHDSDREYLHSVFGAAAALPSLGGLLAEGESPLWLVDPPADACTRLLTRFRAIGDAGNLVHDFTDPAWSTRFLGDLYQDLSQYAKDTYALLQTPDFVEEFILDRTLTPAIETFGLAGTTLIDPTCGSGHFLLGAFDRLFHAWRDAEPGVEARILAQRALGQVTGVDLNPFAAAIARFRLLVAALKVSGITRLADRVDLTINVAVGDSLLWGARPGQLTGMEVAATDADRQFLYRTEHADILRKIFDKHYTAVVGNPPYIVCRDPALNRQYRDRYGSCHRQYSLGVPFTEKFFDLALTPDSFGRPAGFVGMITTNSFMKREFGKKLIEKFVPTWDLTHVVDTSGAYIPGHGTPTVILFGRHQCPAEPTIRAVMGIRGAPSSPTDPSKGVVWMAIMNQIDEVGSESAFVSVADADRERFGHHPWSIGGGGAAELKSQTDEVGGPDRQLRSITAGIGGGAVAGEDECFLKLGDLPRLRDSDHMTRLIVGDEIRDWINYRHPRAMMVDATSQPEAVELEILWPYRTTLYNRRRFGVSLLDLGEPWWPWRESYPDRAETDPLIGFVKVASQPHFVLRHDPSLVFKDSAPTVLLTGTTPDDQLGLVGILNSSVACFWMQQVFHNKGAGGGARVDAGYAARGDEGFLDIYEHDASKLQQFPLPLKPWPTSVARGLDLRATRFATRQPATVCLTATPTRARLDVARAESARILAEMVSGQEELDWACLQLYGLTDEPLTATDGETVPPLQLGERAFEIVLARKVAAGEVETAWFTRHRSVPITDPPAHWPGWYRELVERRIDLIERDRDVALVERPEHKRRWAREPWEKLEEAALRAWLADRLEDRRLWFEGAGDAERAVCRSVAQLADRIGAIDPEFFNVARLWKGAVEIDPVSVIAELVTEEHVPAQSAARYKGKGLDKRAVWERTWDLQRMEDRGEPLPDGLARIPVPPKYAPVDFAKPSYWKQRGKLDVPKERFTSIVGAEREADPTLVLAWAGFDHAQVAQAIATLAYERQGTEGWDPERLWPIVVGLIELLPWLAQWHSEVDPRSGDSPANQYRAMAEQLALAGDRTLADAAKWAPATPTRGRKKKDAS